MIQAQRWIVRVPKQDGAALVELLPYPDLQLATDGDWFWVRGQFASEPCEESDNTEPNKRLHVSLSRLLNADRFYLLHEGQLVPFRQVVPVAEMPNLVWEPFASAVQLQFPLPSLVGSPFQPVALKLVRGTSRFHTYRRQAELVVSEFEKFHGWVEHASELRMAKLQFACNNDGQVAVRGFPLPPLMGRWYSIFDSLAIPQGWHWEPAVSSETLLELLGSQPGSLTIWSDPHHLQEIHAKSFLDVTRSSVRATRRSLKLNG
ncbi:MAG TPA: hypothetical protein PKD64_13290 [Pirellulaceae bacterium]|nr:hypothetical protein [Pirellulaceae bacterium]HMO93161.1 hypothetical protein [Pirellulaceae bacterium]HMP70010.1 hypothetical protein [Pirellulaceae bacterium]